mmetsp:Transcript_15783/g.28759  ORF Transcript_15783/g.28759 Transcript_15783/m.28759 type:complete len:280 (-) Transcript_15783:25-864(-)
MRRQWAPPMLDESSKWSRSRSLSGTGPAEDAAHQGVQGGQVVSLRPASLILPGLFVGTMADAADALWRSNPLGVHAVVNCAQDEFLHQVRKGRVGSEASSSWEELKHSFEKLEEVPQGGGQCGTVMGLDYLGFCARDPLNSAEVEGETRPASHAYSISKHFAVSRAFVAEHLQLGHTVLVHCLRGENRSAAICAAFLICEHGLDAEQAIDRLRDKRGEFALSNEIFVRELHTLSEKMAAERKQAAAEQTSPQTSPPGRQSPASETPSSKTIQSQACCLL